MADAVPRDLLEPPAVVGRHLALHGRDDVAALVEPVADQLRELLLQGHAGVQRADALGHHGQLGQLARRGDGVGHVLSLGHPFTAPCRPFTMRFCIARKNTSAGIIASVVKANTPAVSAECSVEKSATPRGSVRMSPRSSSSGRR